MSRGVVYFNAGSGCLARLLVSLHSLRRHYHGPVTIISTGDVSNSFFRQWVSPDDGLKASIIEADFPNITAGRNQVLLQKTSVHRFTPYDTTIFLDADTLVRGPLEELAELAERFDFVVPRFADWNTGKRMIVRRIECWSELYPQDIHRALSFGPAVNCGVFAFIRSSAFVKQWTQLVMPGRHLFIPDESGMQVLLHRFPHFVADESFNVSCIHSDPLDPAARVIHYHGNKHCRLDRQQQPLYGAELWINEFQHVCDQNLWNIQRWLPAGDRTLRRYLKVQTNQTNSRAGAVDPHAASVAMREKG